MNVREDVVTLIATMIPSMTVSAIATTARVALDPDGMGFWRSATTMVGGIAMGTLVGHALQGGVCSEAWRSAFVAGAAFLSRDIAYLLLKQAARYRDNPRGLIRDVRGWVGTKEERKP
jgi:hypothetical protein